MNKTEEKVNRYDNAYFSLVTSSLTFQQSIFKFIDLCDISVHCYESFCVTIKSKWATVSLTFTIRLVIGEAIKEEVA